MLSLGGKPMQQQLGNQKQLVTPVKNTNWRVWWQLLRPHTLTAAFVPVFVGTVLALDTGSFHLMLFLAMMVASLLIQAATNMFNEYYDYKRGLDTHESVGIGGAIVREGIAPKTVMKLAFTFLAIATLLGVYICMETSWWIAVIGIISMAAGYFYTGGPYPIAYTPFGEIASGFFMGYVIILISFFIQASTVSLDAVLVSTPIAILVGGILMANNIRDHDGDKENGRHTLAILLGQQHAIKFLAGMFAVSYLWVVGLILFNDLTVWSLLVFISLPKAMNAIKGFLRESTPAGMMPAMGATAKTNTIFGFFLGVGILLGYWI